jgi:drug/metabolite transporter (DMT)-like permease
LGATQKPMARFNQSQLPSRLVAIISGMTAVGIWATSFVLVKMGLAYTGPFTLDGLRYFLAFLLLLPWLARRTPMRVLPAPVWWRLFLIGVTVYAIGNGALFLGLMYVPATTASLVVSLSLLLILLMGIFWLQEIPTW